jgi:hypothetical protein
LALKWHHHHGLKNTRRREPRTFSLTASKGINDGIRGNLPYVVNLCKTTQLTTHQ